MPLYLPVRYIPEGMLLTGNSQNHLWIFRETCKVYLFAAPLPDESQDLAAVKTGEKGITNYARQNVFSLVNNVSICSVTQAHGRPDEAIPVANPAISNIVRFRQWIGSALSRNQTGGVLYVHKSGRENYLTVIFIAIFIDLVLIRK